MRAGQPAKLRDLGYGEIWLQNWLADDPARLGLGVAANAASSERTARRRDRPSAPFALLVLDQPRRHVRTVGWT